MYKLFRMIVIVSGRLPGWMIEPIGSLGGILFWLVAKGARKQATENMVHVLGEEIIQTRQGRWRLRRTVQGVFQNSVRNYLQAFALPATSAKTIVDTMQVEGEEHLKEALAKGKGVILFSAHFGPFDYLSQWIAIKGYDLTIPVENLKDQRMLDLMLSLRRSHGVHFLPLGGSAPMRTMLQALRNNKIVLITADRAVQGERVEMPFFGDPAELPSGPAALATRTGATVVGAFGWRTYRANGKRPIEGTFSPLSLALPVEERTDMQSVMRGIVDRMEQHIAAHPEQWVVFAPIWKSTKNTVKGEA
ncbi:MAG TPA: lysophospholipid acyltransferase family protein [Ktedonobacteraceae bacterium]|nr:lysophospholipid acyltransferase family protein [Ktedonobacteraceae bacterium]